MIMFRNRKMVRRVIVSVLWEWVGAENGMNE